MRTIYFLLTFFLLAVTVDGNNQRRGKLEVLQCTDSKYTYSIILPPSYKEKPDKKFPALFITSPSARATPMGLEKWAADNEVMIILNRDSKNGMDSNIYPNIQKAIMNTIESKYRIHPFLRFSAGVSGGAMESSRFARDYGDKWSGVILHVHSGNGIYPPNHCAIAYLAGEDDEIHPPKYVQAAYEKMKAAGAPVHIRLYPKRGHKAAPVEDVIKELDWMLNLKRYNHPSINAAYVKEITPELEKEIQEALKIEDASKKMEELQKFMVIPWITSLKGYPDLAKQYVKAKFEYAEQETDPLESWVTLVEVMNSVLYKKADSNVQASITAKVRKLERNKDVLKEKAAMGKYFRAYKMHQKYNSSKKKSAKERAKILKEYQSILDRYSDSRAATKATEAMKDF